MLSIKNLTVNVKNKSILNGLNLKIKKGEIHVIMGQNGSGKSTLSSTIVGYEEYKVISGTVFFKKQNLFDLNPEDRAKKGIFMAFQYPIDLPGISNRLFLQTIINTFRKYKKKTPLDRFDLEKLIKNKINLLNMPSDFLTRSVNVGFSGGEKKKNDILQMMLLKPDLCILDETDSGLDIDALKIVSKGINSLKNKNRSFIIITHYHRILNYIKPNYIHILHHGYIIKSGDFSLIKNIEEQGYAKFIKT
ncbi:Probable ATP-dependent transporter SufC [Candidatus Westeberhardia cardiocondylae]|uniref:Probable ATP-dependent transporter SufC n=1 Tax=Candidatus Westeberhardia cardiocondylae TaxID=1594731 RepID=A0A0H5BX69_9ENTR|nr:Fe-S cluster assembly ATPase SufC [Candidatus Westeberhardia cardiocondylae]CEN32214.1 Probable ATP-dependent transporter SufC [Candidatus Westeberhardia cardiocondylae]